MRAIRWKVGTFCCLFACLFHLLFSYSALAQQSTRNDVNIVVAIDCSYSVNPVEFNLQIAGIAKVFSDPEIVAAIADGPRGSIGIMVSHWSTSKNQKISVPWTRISNASDAIRLAAQVAGSDRLTVEGGTSISGVLRHSQAALEAAPFASDRRIINLIADGENNNGERVESARDWTVRFGTIINAVAIINERSWLHHYLRNRVIGGPGAFVERADDYVDFVRAFKKKLLREIKGAPIARLPRNSRKYALGEAETLKSSL